MTSLNVHRERIAEHLQVIADAIAVGIERRPATIGLHASACSIDLLELYLHISGNISAGAVIKHEWFKAPKPEQKILPLAERKLGGIFPDKEKVLRLMYIIEEHRNKLIYGKPSLGGIEMVLRTFQQLYTLLKDKLKEKEIYLE